MEYAKLFRILFYCCFTITLLFTSATMIHLQVNDKTINPSSSYPNRTLDQNIRGLEDDLAQLDAFAIELQNNETANGYIIIYGGKQGRKNQAKARVEFVKSYLVKNRGLDLSRLFIIDGGYREKFHWEMWLVPQGKELPKPTPMVDEKDVKFDGEADVCGYDLCSLYDLSDGDIQDEKAQLDSFATELLNDSTKRGLIKVYGSKQSRKKISVSRIKHYLTNNRHIPPNRLEVVKSDYRNHYYFKMWFIYESKEPSKSSPNSKKINDYDIRSYDDDTTYLDDFAIELQNDKTANGYVIVYGGKRGYKNEAKARLVCMRDYLIQDRGIEASRLFFIDGGYQEKLHAEMWFVPKGEEQPKPTPTISPREVKFKGVIKVKSRCNSGI